MKVNILPEQYKSMDKSHRDTFNNHTINLLNLPHSAIGLMRRNGNINTISDLYEISSLDLFHILNDDYLLFKDTTTALNDYGITLFKSTDKKYLEIKRNKEESIK